MSVAFLIPEARTLSPASQLQTASCPKKLSVVSQTVPEPASAPAAAAAATSTGSAPAMACWESDVFRDCDWKVIIISTLAVLFVGGAIAVLVVAFAVVYPPKATVDDAVLQRFTLAPGNTNNISYNLTATLSLRNPNMYRGIEYEPMAVALAFNGSRFDESGKKVAAASLHRARRTATFRFAMGGAELPLKPQLTVAGAREFAAENATGRFDVELRLDTVLRYKGRKAKCPLAVVCPLKLQLVDPEVPATAYQKTKCTVLRAKKAGC